MDVLFVLLKLFNIVHTAFLSKSYLIIVGLVPAFFLQKMHKTGVLSHVRYLLQLNLHPSPKKWVIIISPQEIFLRKPGNFDLGSIAMGAADSEVLSES